MVNGHHPFLLGYGTTTAAANYGNMQSPWVFKVILVDNSAILEPHTRRLRRVNESEQVSFDLMNIKKSWGTLYC